LVKINPINQARESTTQEGNRSKMARKTDDATIVKMIEQGKSQKEIAKHFGVSPAAICKRLKRLRASQTEPESFEKLTDKEKKFVLAKAEGKTHSQASLDAFECGSLASAKSIGSHLMKRDDIQLAICDIMEQEGIGRRHRIRTLKKHIDNNLDSHVSLKGVDIANKMEGLYTNKHLHLHATPEDPEEILRKYISKVRERIALRKKIKNNYMLDLQAEFPGMSRKKLEAMTEQAMEITCPEPEISEEMEEILQNEGYEIVEGELIENGAN